MKQLTTLGIVAGLILAGIVSTGASALAGPGPASPFDEAAPAAKVGNETIGRAAAKALGSPVDFAASLAAGAGYLRHAQADFTEDNAGNGTSGIDEIPNDPDDGGWDWRLTAPAFTHSTAASSTNLYGATAQGALRAYLASPTEALWTTLADAADRMAANDGIRSAADLIFLMRFDDLADGTTYQDAARAKYTARIDTYGSAAALAIYIRDVRNSQGYPNGIIGWDIGTWAVAVQMLADRYPGVGYDADADAIAEVLWQDSFNNNPGYFDVIDDQGFDPTYADKNFWWYNLGITGLIDAFRITGSHTAAIPGLVAILLAGQHSDGGIDDSFGINLDNEDWQTTAYAAMTLAALDRAAYQPQINRMAYYLAATQDASGAWAYSNGNHYPEVGGECTAAVSYGLAATDALVDEDFTSQADVDAYNLAHGTTYVFGYDAFGSIQAAIDAVEGSTVTVAAGIYEEQVVIGHALTLQGAGAGATVIRSPLDMPVGFNTGSSTKYAVVYVHDTAATISDLTVDGAGRGNLNVQFVGIGFWNAGGAVADVHVTGVRDTPFSGAQHGVSIYAYNNTGGPYTLALTDVLVDDIQKNALALIGNGLTVDLDRVTTIGAGPTGVTAQNGIQISGGAGGTVDDCVVDGIDYTGTGWTASAILLSDAAPVAMTGVDIDGSQTSCYFYNTSVSFTGGSVTDPTGKYGLLVYNTDTSKSASPLQASPYDGELAGKGMAGAKALATSVVSGATLAGTGVAGSSGILAYAVGDIDIDVTGCTVTGWDSGVVVYEAGSTITGEAHGNLIYGNLTEGAYSNTAVDYDMTGNWWGAADGPHHPIANPLGSGDEVSDQIEFDPWLGGNVAMVPDPGTIGLDDGPPYTEGAVFTYLGGGSGPLYGFSIEVTWDPAIVSGGSFSRPAAGPFATASLFFAQPITNGVRIDAALGGAASGITAGDLFQAVFTAVGTPDHAVSPVWITVRSARDGANQPLSGLAGDTGSIVVDLTAPVVTAVAIANLTLAHTDDWVKNGDEVRVTATVTDGDIATIVANLTGLGGGAAVAPDLYEVGTATWTLAGATTMPADGDVTVTVTATDGLGNVTTGSDGITADNTPPSALTGMAAAPGHNKVVLSWNDPSGNDANYYGVVVRYDAWGDYPLYNAAAPAYPAAPTAGDGEAFNGLGVVAGATHTFPANGTGRDIVYYGGFVYDWALNYSPAAGGGAGNDRATNYWLGDVFPATCDGLVEVGDITVLGTAYGTVSGGAGFNAQADVGPTDDHGRLGIPTPDDMVEFEDLMIFAMNFGLVGPAKAAPAGSPAPALVWEQIDEVTWALRLSEPCASFKGLHLTGRLPAGTAVSVAAGELLSRQSAPVFLRNIERLGLDAGVAVLGTDVVILGSGELLRVTLSQPGAPADVAVEARSATNESFTIAAVQPGTPPASVLFGLDQNAPNPFNPSTRIAFNLPSAARIRLAVYALDGRLVRLLADEQRPAGRHELTWDGLDAAGRQVASGTYVYRLIAGERTESRKMILMK